MIYPNKKDLLFNKYINEIEIIDINTLIIDCDNDINNKYDIILHWGLLYHLHEIDTHLEKVFQKCDMLLLETEVSDSDDKHFYISTNESGSDQAFNNKGIRPSQYYVENIIEKKWISI